MQNHPYTDIVMVLAILVFVWTSIKVGGARAAYKVPAPATDGPPEFQQAFRVQMNTLEQIVWYLPALWLFATAWGDVYAAAVGIFWPIGRIAYALGYYKAPEKRGAGFGITFLCSAILLLGGLAGTIMRML